MDNMDIDDDVELNVLRCRSSNTSSGTTADIKVCNRT